MAEFSTREMNEFVKIRMALQDISKQLIIMNRRNTVSNDVNPDIEELRGQYFRDGYNKGFAEGVRSQIDPMGDILGGKNESI